jgi:hypothetical protein
MEGMKRTILKDALFQNIADLYPGQFSLLHPWEKIGDLHLFPVSQEIGNPLHSFDRIRGCLGVTPGYNDQGIRIGPDSPPDQLAGLEVGPVGHSASIDDHDIRFFPSRGKRIALLFQLIHQGLRLELIDLASERGNGNGRHSPLKEEWNRKSESWNTGIMERWEKQQKCDNDGKEPLFF